MTDARLARAALEALHTNTPDARLARASVEVLWTPLNLDGGGAGPTVKWWDGAVAQAATVRGWWDGAAEQPVTAAGWWWDGTTAQPLA